MQNFPSHCFEYQFRQGPTYECPSSVNLNFIVFWFKVVTTGKSRLSNPELMELGFLRCHHHRHQMIHLTTNFNF